MNILHATELLRASQSHSHVRGCGQRDIAKGAIPNTLPNRIAIARMGELAADWAADFARGMPRAAANDEAMPRSTA